MNNLPQNPSNHQEGSEKDLIQAVQRGDFFLFGELVTLHKQKVFGTLLGIVRSWQDAEDLTQEVFLKAFKKINSFGFNSSFYTWLYRIAVNSAIDFKRKQKKIKPVTIEEEKGGLDVLLTHSEHAPRKNPSADEKEREVLLNEAIDSLDPLHRAIIQMREIEGFSYAEIAEILKINMGTVMSRLFNARKKLRLTLEKMGVA